MRVRGRTRGQGLNWQQEEGKDSQLGSQIIEPYGLSTLAWTPLRVSWSQVGRPCQRAHGSFIGP